MNRFSCPRVIRSKTNVRGVIFSFFFLSSLSLLSSLQALAQPRFVKHMVTAQTLILRLNIITPTLPAGKVATAYKASIGITGGRAPYTFTVNRGTVPPGLSLSSTGVLSGTPTTAGLYSFHVVVSDPPSTIHGDGTIYVTIQSASSSGGTGSGGSTTPAVAIAIAPGTVTLSSAAKQQFTATVSNTSNTSVLGWASFPTKFASRSHVSETAIFIAEAVMRSKDFA